jgi:DNA-binding XRE family transcriptional regulator
VGDAVSLRDEIDAARQELGRQLRAWRTRARLTQRELAQMIGYSRSAIASAEVGQPASGDFWAAVDRAVGAGGQLVSRHARIEAAVTAARQRAARQGWEARPARAVALEPAMAGELEQGATAVQDRTCPSCHEPLAVVVRLITTLIPQITAAQSQD